MCPVTSGKYSVLLLVCGRGLVLQECARAHRVVGRLTE